MEEIKDTLTLKKVFIDIEMIGFKEDNNLISSIKNELLNLLNNNINRISKEIGYEFEKLTLQVTPVFIGVNPIYKKEDKIHLFSEEEYNDVFTPPNISFQISTIGDFTLDKFISCFEEKLQQSINDSIDRFNSYIRPLRVKLYEKVIDEIISHNNALYGLSKEKERLESFKYRDIDIIRQKIDKNINRIFDRDNK